VQVNEFAGKRKKYENLQIMEINSKSLMGGICR